MTNKEYNQKRMQMVQYQATAAAQLTLIVTLFGFGVLLMLNNHHDLLTFIALKIIGIILIRIAYLIYIKLRNK